MSTKDTVLAIFERNRGFFVSGEQIASELNITRTAVWKAVKILQKEGYEITFKDFVKIGVPFTLTAVITGYAFIWIFWH